MTCAPHVPPLPDRLATSWSQCTDATAHVAQDVATAAGPEPEAPPRATSPLPPRAGTVVTCPDACVSPRPGLTRPPEAAALRDPCSGPPVCVALPGTSPPY
eukprot:4433902-Alexandrium_andersonii.AAC.1